jgi:hypothetical protein
LVPETGEVQTLVYFFVKDVVWFAGGVYTGWFVGKIDCGANNDADSRNNVWDGG